MRWNSQYAVGTHQPTVQPDEKRDSRILPLSSSSLNAVNAVCINRAPRLGDRLAKLFPPSEPRLYPISIIEIRIVTSVK